MTTMNSGGSFDSPRPEPIKVWPIEADAAKEQLIFWKDKSLSRKKFKMAFLLSLLEERALILVEEDQSSLEFTKELKQTLIAFKKLLETLSHEDVSQNYQFADKLSTFWHILLKFIHEERQQKSPSPLLTPIESFMQKLYQYPEGRDHRLGYYLEHLAGEKWLPFPFMEILHSLFEEAILSRESSHLYRWISDLEKLI